MRYSDLFGKTRRDAPSELTDPARRLAFRAGLVRILEGEQEVFLPLAARVLARMSTELRGGLRALGAQELRVTASPDLSMLAAREIQSYKHLPARLYWLEAGGTQLHIASIGPAKEAAEPTAQAFGEFAIRFFEWAQVPCYTAGDIGESRIWYSPASVGEVEILLCSARDYAATRASARVNKPQAQPENPMPLEEVATPHCDTIDSLARFLSVPAARTAKAVFYYGEVG